MGKVRGLTLNTNVYAREARVGLSEFQNRCDPPTMSREKYESQA